MEETLSGTQLRLVDEQFVPEDTEAFCAAQAEVIRALGKRMCGDIVEIGRRLIAVKERVGHGNWLNWLADEFGWSDRTARKFMDAADRFGSLKLEPGSDLQIDASALYLLSREKVPEEVRAEAVEKAEAGEHLTKEAAERLIADRVVAALNQAREAAEAEKAAALEEARERLASEQAALQQQIDDTRAELEVAKHNSDDGARKELEAQTLDLQRQLRELSDRILNAETEKQQAIKNAVKQAIEPLREKYQELRDKLAELNEEEREPDLQDAIEIICKISGKKKLSTREVQYLAACMGMGIEHGGKIISPATPEQSHNAEFALKISSDFQRSLSFIAETGLHPQQVYEACPPFLRKAAKEGIPHAIQWLETFLEIAQENTQ